MPGHASETGGCRLRAVLLVAAALTLLALGFFAGTSRGRVSVMMTAWPLIRPANYRRRAILERLAKEPAAVDALKAILLDSSDPSMAVTSLRLVGKRDDRQAFIPTLVELLGRSRERPKRLKIIGKGPPDPRSRAVRALHGFEESRELREFVREALAARLQRPGAPVSRDLVNFILRSSHCQDLGVEALLEVRPKDPFPFPLREECRNVTTAMIVAVAKRAEPAARRRALLTELLANRSVESELGDRLVALALKSEPARAADIAVALLQRSDSEGVLQACRSISKQIGTRLDAADGLRLADAFGRRGDGEAIALLERHFAGRDLTHSTLPERLPSWVGAVGARALRRYWSQATAAERRALRFFVVSRLGQSPPRQARLALELGYGESEADNLDAFEFQTLQQLADKNALQPELADALTASLERLSKASLDPKLLKAIVSLLESLKPE